MQGFLIRAFCLCDLSGCVGVCFVYVFVHVCTLQVMSNGGSGGVGGFAIFLDLQVACGLVVERKRMVLLLLYSP